MEQFSFSSTHVMEPLVIIHSIFTNHVQQDKWEYARARNNQISRSSQRNVYIEEYIYVSLN